MMQFSPKSNDEIIEQSIFQILTSEKRSFFISAGAGAGKTRALVKTLEKLRDTYGFLFSQTAKKIAVITYTNAAKDEIKRRLQYNPVFEVSTIHSFSWALIDSYTKDIQTFLHQYLTEKQTILRQELDKGRPGTKTYLGKQEKFLRTQKRINSLGEIVKFIYDPMGENLENNALQHQEVIDIASSFINNKPIMRNLICKKYPILLIDECQDTNKQVIEALLSLEAEFHPAFLMGLFGDMMQRIYPDGKTDLETALPDSWVRVSKNTNHRSSKRVVELINKIRSSVDNYVQIPRDDASEGLVRFFIASSESIRKSTEEKARLIMREEAKKAALPLSNDETKVLILEHHLASIRDGFANLFISLNDVSTFKQGSIDGSLPFLVMLKNRIVPLFMGIKANDQFLIANVIQKHSEYLQKDDPKDFYHRANNAVSSLMKICKSEPLMLFQFIQPLIENRIFEFGEDILFVVSNGNVETEDLGNEELNGIKNALKCNIFEAVKYIDYLGKLSSFDTHQGVKGLEYESVLVVLDDQQARGFMFSYDKLFGLVPKSNADFEHEKKHEETSIDRTRRLFYVTCSRARKTLAIVAYTDDCAKLHDNLQKLNWFFPLEIIQI